MIHWEWLLIVLNVGFALGWGAKSFFKTRAALMAWFEAGLKR